MSAFYLVVQIHQLLPRTDFIREGKHIFRLRVNGLDGIIHLLENQHIRQFAKDRKVLSELLEKEGGRGDGFGMGHHVPEREPLVIDVGASDIGTELFGGAFISSQLKCICANAHPVPCQAIFIIDLLQQLRLLGTGNYIISVREQFHTDPVTGQLLSIERFTIPWFGIICRKKDERFIYGKLASYFGEDNVGLIPNGIGVMIGGYRVGPPVPSFIDDYTKERLFIVETSELEQKGIVPISLDETPLLENLLAAENQIKQNHPDFSLDSIPDDDPETFKMLSEGDTEWLPFLSDRGMKKNLNFLEPNNLDELDAIMSLYYNGPLDLIPMYLDAKRGMMPEGYQELMAIEPLKRTYGVIVYMEQVIEILKRYAGFSDADARSFRHLLMIGKRESIENKKKEFLVDADMLGRDQQLSTFILKMIECFSTDTGFGFKRKVGYWHSVLAYRNAYIKCHFSSGIQNL